MKTLLAKILYGLAFVVLLPALLLLWATALDAKYPALPAIKDWPLGWPLVLVGAALVLRATWELWRFGGGLPMNAFPPRRHVSRGLYGWLPHPIYVGFAFIMLGGFALLRLPAGIWIVSPVLWMGATALVVGYERVALHRQFGESLPRPLLALPPSAPEPPRWWHRLAAYVLVLGPWLVAYEGTARLLRGQTGIATFLPFEQNWRTIEWTAALYAGTYAWVALAPLAATSQAALRRLIRDGWVGSAFIFWCFLVFPLSAAPRPFAATNGLGRLLELDRTHDVALCAFPSFHVFWPFLAARLWTGRLPAAISYGLASLMALSCLTTGMHSLVDVVAGFGVFAVVNQLDDAWRALLRLTERVANSWRDWRVGRVRLINHGAYVGMAAAGGCWLVTVLAGKAHAGAVLLVALCSLLGAGIWAQCLESSSGLSRPFGYYGGIFGGSVGVLIAQLWRGDGWLLFSAFAATAPLIQGVGRLRCLVQGCCHGRPCPDPFGIRYRQPLSRVCKMAHWTDQPVYPTPLYSIIGNGIILGLVLRLWTMGAPLGLIAGAYLILSACARFMEEGYRGEPQTLRFGGLAVYQWLALLFVIAGAGFMVLPGPPAPPIGPLTVLQVFYAIPFGLLVWFAMGVDFPDSNRRFSRLA